MHSRELDHPRVDAVRTGATAQQNKYESHRHAQKTARRRLVAGVRRRRRGTAFLLVCPRLLGGDPTTQHLRDTRRLTPATTRTLESFAARRARRGSRIMISPTTAPIWTRCARPCECRAARPAASGRTSFALRTIAAHAAGRVCDSGRAARGAGRFVVIDPQNIMIILQRTRRRQHYNLIVRRDHAHTFSRDEIDAHWAVRGDADEAPRAAGEEDEGEVSVVHCTRYISH